MSAEVKETRTTDRRAETGWARARRLRGSGLRTCVRATLDGEAGDVGETWPGTEGNVVRGVD
ncbi:hypothetical protein ACOT81_31195 [Streptomyces sp. WI04-05B]|uniref:hypothetical protein n=1 Tax=Streptomyces TaxID=1883 RepID=UPI0029BE9D01|nr:MULTISPECIES: hypothetical protein [unclassified Streptomyces]MDX2542240.1 hypothetical protein [Streptomyces sp. WI04-05B]MDX2584072.1 hypothetical protein [Streptomyces sp. WI04-05A]MDX3750215.1 hypothetical protein [Streptomyces sp. AK08-02]